MVENQYLDQIICGNCIDILAQIPEKSVDLVFADPPYNLQLKQELWRPNHTKVKAVVDEWDKFADFEEYDQFTFAWLSGCKRVLKDTGTLWVIGTYHNIYRIGKILQDMNFWILNDVIFLKKNPMPNFRGVRFTNAHEILIWAQKNKGAKYTFNYHAMKSLNDDLQMRSDWFLPIVTGKERIRVNGIKVHSTQKPEALLYRILLSSSEPNDLVLDPFFGSGTTGAVAKKLGRHFIGIEQNQEYIRVARERIASIISAPDWSISLFEPRLQTRISFGALLEAGLIQPGQTLYFLQDGITASVLANGQIQTDGMTGSIHAVAKSLLQGSPTNGWDCWYAEDENGNLIILDKLRQKIRIAKEQNTLN